MANPRSIIEINERVAKGDAIVLTAQETCDIVKGGENLTIKDVDVVTTATRAIMSGTYAILSFPIAEPCSFIRANRVWINGVPTSIGPCPNERLGIVDLMVFGSHIARRIQITGAVIFSEILLKEKRFRSRPKPTKAIPLQGL